MNHFTVFRYSCSSSSATSKARNKAMICNTTAVTKVVAGMKERSVQWPGDSKPQNRKKPSVKPSNTVIAVMIPCR